MVAKKLLLVIFTFWAINRPAYAQADSPYAALGHAIGTLISTLISNMRENSSEKQVKSPPLASSSESSQMNDPLKNCLLIEDADEFSKCYKKIQESN